MTRLLSITALALLACSVARAQTYDVNVVMDNTQGQAILDLTGTFTYIPGPVNGVTLTIGTIGAVNLENAVTRAIYSNGISLAGVSEGIGAPGSMPVALNEFAFGSTGNKNGNVDLLFPQLTTVPPTNLPNNIAVALVSYNPSAASSFVCDSAFGSSGAKPCSGNTLKAVQSVKAPELHATSAIAALTLLLGGVAVLKGWRQA